MSEEGGKEGGRARACIQILERDFALRGLDADEPMMIFRRELALNGQSDSDQRVRRQVYDLITRDVVSDRILSAYFTRAIPSADQLLHFKREFAAQMGLASFVSFILSVADRSPHKFAVSRANGRVRQLEMYLQYNANYVIDVTEVVPFRMTRNLTTFFGPWLVEGVVASTLTATAACLARNQEAIKNFLQIFVRDDTVSFQASKMPGLPDGEQQTFENHARDRISTSVSLIRKRCHNMMPPNVADKVSFARACMHA